MGVDIKVIKQGRLDLTERNWECPTVPPIISNNIRDDTLIKGSFMIRDFRVDEYRDRDDI